MTYGFDDFSDDSNGLNDWADFQQRYGSVDVAVPTITKAAIYCRRSIADPSDKSIGRQLEECTAHCRAQGFAYDTDRLLFVDVDRSGASMEGREGLHAALAAGERGEFDVLVFEEVDRLTRDVLDAHRIRSQLQRHNILMHAAGTGALKLVPLTLRAFHAERERSRTFALTSAGCRTAAGKGEFLGRRRIFGYVCLPAERTWAIDEQEAAALREAFRWIDEENASLSEVCRRLETMGIAPACGARWHAPNLYSRGGWGLLQNTLLKGVWRYAINQPEPVTIDLPHLAIIETDRFNRVNAKLDLRSSLLKPRSVRQQGLITGILSCAVCGGPMSDTPGGRTDRRIYCYAAFQGRCSERFSLNTSAVERQVLLTISDDLLSEERREGWNARRLYAWQALDVRLASGRSMIEDELRVVAERLEDLRRSADDHPPLARLAMADDELTHRRLVLALEEITLSAPIEIDASEAAEIKEEISRLLMRLPITMRTERDRSLVARLRTLVPRLTLAREPGGGGYHLGVLLGFVDGREPKVDDAAPDADRWLHRRIPKPGFAALKSPERILAWHKAAAEGAYELSDRDWASIAHLFEPLKLKSYEPRRFAEALVMLAATGMPHSLLPERYAFVRKRVYEVRRLGIWPEVMSILRGRQSPRLEGLDPRRFDPRPWSLRRRSAAGP